MMPDTTFDAVMVGGGNKSLLLALYLVKYGGMSVGIFERRHEIGGCLATEESAAPGFRGNCHATIILPWYYLPVWRDFPEFWDYGAQWEQYRCSNGYVFSDKENCLAIYSQKHDPTQERTAKEIARFSQRDAEKWLKLWQLWQSDEMQRVQVDGVFLPPELRQAPEVMERQAAILPKVFEAGFVPDSILMSSSMLHVAQEQWESLELQSCILRFALSGVTDVNESGRGIELMGMTGTLPTIGFNRGGTHQIAHAAHQILVQSGCKFFTHAEVDKVIIENGEAKGIRLKDGSQVGARKLVVSAGLNAAQLCFDLIGREHLDALLAKRVELLERNFGALMWYTFALHKAPQYKAAAFNPDINECMWLGLARDPDPEHVARECMYVKLKKWPPLEDYCPTVWCHSLVDPTYAPPGKHTANTEQIVPPVTAHTEAEWLEIKKRYAEELVSIWQQHAPNMTWDNVIGVDTNSPYDCLRMKNMAPTGQMGGLDRTLSQINENRPTPELANHRTPVKNLYATGCQWHTGSSASASESYNCYRVIATDLGLGKPWEEPGKEEPDSLVQQLQAIEKRLQTMVSR
jgi:beta-carotene ketolase (CrtO type)